MRTTRTAGALAAGLLAAGTTLTACDGPSPLELEPARAPAFGRGAPDSAALARAGITWQVIKVVPPADSSVAVGETLRLESIVRFDDATVRNKSTVEWTSSDSSVASTLSTGLVTGRRAGTALLTASIAWRGLVHRDTVRLTVGDVAAAEDSVAVEVMAGPAAPEAPDAPEAAEPEAAPQAVRPVDLSALAGMRPALPRATVDTRMPAQTGRTISVRAGDDLQDALDAARPGDVVLLQNGATFAGSFRLRRKSGAGWIVIRPASMAGIPQPGTRVTPANAAAMPKIVMPGGNEGAIRAMEGAGYYRLVGLEITAAPAARDFNAIVRLHVNGAKQLAELPHHIILDRTYVHGQPDQAVTRCVMMNSAWTAVVDSYLSECHAKGRDSQAISSWTGSGPFKIENNYLEGAGENVMFGGAKAESPEVAPADIEIRGNHFFKPMAWRASKRWTVKNLLEIKQGQRVLVENNVLENNWVDAQTGRAILIRAADQELSAWSRTSDITVRYNVIRNSTSGVSIDGQGLYETTRRVLVANNLFYDIGDRALGYGGLMFQLTGKTMRDIVIDHNTALFSEGDDVVRRYAIMFDRGPHEQLAVTNNVFELGEYGVRGSGEQGGAPSLARYAPGAVVGGNVLIGSTSRSRYAALGQVVSSLAALNVSSTALTSERAAGTMRLAGAPVSAGVDMDQLRRRTASVVR